MHSVTSQVDLARGSASTLREQIPSLSQEQQRCLDTIRDSHERALEAMKCVSHYARPLGRFQKVNLQTLTKAVLVEGLPIKYECEWQEVFVSGSEVRLKEAVRNVVINAKQAADKRDRSVNLRVTLQKVTQEGRVFARLEIIDDAGGMPGGLAEKISKGYYSTLKGYDSTQGDSDRGLGLPIVKKVVAGHGGRLEIRAVPNGTSIIMYLPALASVGESLDADAAAGR
ncbi:putative Histidine kinase [Candidatus Sulfopaludibacter sp. SbA4]|nr:putative Histidine kinase [Candidatus Sulfopaludibacter sp. SbA4]